ncbi:hypothetical protein V8687_22500 [Shewanella baltica]|uniref:hypothetical protein n=1 Tax=Shewanella baltica TaxID=62322 RepID=UPI0030CBA44D
MFKPKLLSLLIATSLLTACSGSDDKDDTTPIPEPTPPTEYAHNVTGQVSYIGAIAGANVCVDLNQDLSCSEGEPSTTTDTDGKYQIDWKSETEKPNYYLLANWIETTQSPAIKSKASYTTANGNITIVSLQDHFGAINALTNLEYSRYQKMREANMTAEEIDVMRQTLRGLYAKAFNQLDGIIYNVPVDETIKTSFLENLLLHDHIMTLINTRVDAILAAIEVLVASQLVLQDLILGYGFGVEAYLQTNPPAVATKVDNALVSLGYMESPADEKAMTDADWNNVINNLMPKDGAAHSLSLKTAGNLTAIKLDYGVPNTSLIGFVVGKVVTLNEIPAEKNTTEECWNQSLLKWINTARNDQGYIPQEPIIEGNQIKSVYDGTSVQIQIKIDKYNSGAVDWQDLLSSTPAEIKLNQLSWPTLIYRIGSIQSEDVICRQEEPVIFETDAEIPGQISSTLLVKLFWSYAFPNDYTEDSPNKFTIHDGGGDAQYEWSITTGLGDAPLLTITEIVESPVLNEVLLPRYYLFGYNTLTTVEVNKAYDTSVDKQYFNFTYETGFSETVYKHIKSLSTQP